MAGIYIRGAPLLLHFDGTSWSKVNPQVADLNIMGYLAVWGRARNDVFVLADTRDNCNEGFCEALLHWDGTNWTLVADVGSALSGLWGLSPAHVFTYGQGVLWRLEAGTWSPEVLSPRDWYPRAMGGRSADELYLGGDSGRIIHFDGERWSTILSTGIAGEGINGMFTGPNETLAVSSVPAQANADDPLGVLYQMSGNVATEVLRLENANLDDVWIAPSGKIFAVGSCCGSRTADTQGLIAIR